MYEHAWMSTPVAGNRPPAVVSVRIRGVLVPLAGGRIVIAALTGRGGHFPIDGPLFARLARLCALEPGCMTIQPVLTFRDSLVRPAQGCGGRRPAPGHRLPRGARAPVCPPLLRIESGLAPVSGPLPLVGPAFPQISGVFADVRKTLSLISGLITLIRQPFPLVGAALAQLGGRLPLVEQPLPLAARARDGTWRFARSITAHPGSMHRVYEVVQHRWDGTGAPGGMSCRAVVEVKPVGEDVAGDVEQGPVVGVGVGAQP
ncbi:hypothetical protein [Streptomyces rimosus]|uniref:hypothetical protein n=1 Tax=Streptomyces rimosus TaxID=1927 RepID=UPI0037D2051C